MYAYSSKLKRQKTCRQNEKENEQQIIEKQNDDDANRQHKD